MNGAFTVGENIGDLGGLSIALLAYQLSRRRGAGDRWTDRCATRLLRLGAGLADEIPRSQAIRRLATDPHSPPEFRCNGVIRNIDAYYDAFDVDAADELYLAPERRVRIWN